MGGMTQMRKQAPARKSGMKMRMAASPRRSVVRSVKLSNAKLGLVKENEVVRAKKSGVEVAVKTAGVAMPAAGAFSLGKGERGMRGRRYRGEEKESNFT